MNANDKLLFQVHLQHSRKLEEISKKIDSVFDLVEGGVSPHVSLAELQHTVKIMNALNDINEFVVDEFADAAELAECMTVEGRV